MMDNTNAKAKQPKCVYVILETSNGKFLFPKKNKTARFWKGKWVNTRTRITNNPGQRVFPGGHYENKDSIQNEAIKEFFEETGVKLNLDAKPWGLTTYVFDDFAVVYTTLIDDGHILSDMIFDRMGNIFNEKTFLERNLGKVDNELNFNSVGRDKFYENNFLSADEILQDIASDNRSRDWFQIALEKIIEE